jgi:hypothetical protein
MAEISLLEHWKNCETAIADIDEKLDSLDDSSTAGKRSFVNALVKEHEDFWGPSVEKVVSQIEELSFEQQVAVVTGFKRTLDAKFAKQIDEGVQKLVDSQPKREPLITAEEAEQAYKDRSDLRKKMATLRDVIITFNGDEVNPDDFELPPVRRQGAKGQRGPRAISYYSWTDGENDYDTLADVAKGNGYKTVYELRNAMKAAGLELRKPTDEVMTFEMSNGKTLTGTRDPNAPSVEEINEDEDNDTEDETTDTED